MRVTLLNHTPMGKVNTGVGGAVCHMETYNIVTYGKTDNSIYQVSLILSPCSFLVLTGLSYKIPLGMLIRCCLVLRS